MQFLPSIRQAVALTCLALPLAAHGGAYRGPGSTVAPGGGLAGPAGVAGQPIGGTGSAGPSTPDLTRWQLYWQQNRAPLLDLKRHVRSTGPGSGNEGWYMGEGQRTQKISLGPSVGQIRDEVVPALLEVLENETNNDLLSGALVALAKIGDGGDVVEGRRLGAAISAFLDDASQEVRETAAVSLGILASSRALPTLAHLLWDTREGRKLVGKNEVGYRTRAFAAYGLGLTGARTESEFERKMIVSMLRRALERDDTRSRDFEVACLIAIGLVPLATIEAPGAVDQGELPPASSRLAQIEYLLDVLRDRHREDLARAQCPVVLARLLEGLPEPQRARYRKLVAEDLMERLDRDRDDRRILQSCVLALGQIGTNDGQNFLDVRIRRTLAAVPKRVTEPQMRAFALMAMAEVGGRFGADRPSQGIDAARDFLVKQLAWGKNTLEPWAGLACGMLARRLAQQDSKHPALESLRRVSRRSLEAEGSPERVGAYALAAGLSGSLESAPRMMKLLGKQLQDDARGQVALGLALLGHREAVDLLREVVEGSKYRPLLLGQAAIALGILGDKDVSNQLVEMLGNARSLATQAAIASAIGVIGDRRSVDPLLKLLKSGLATDKARAFAAVALGNVADKELLPWNSKIATGLNYRAAPATLFDPLGGKGILDIL